MKRPVSACISWALILCLLALLPVPAFAQDAPRPLPLDGTCITIHKDDTFSVSVPTFTALKVKFYGGLVFAESVPGKFGKDAIGRYVYQIVYLNPGETILHVASRHGYCPECEHQLAVVQVTPLPTVNEDEPANDRSETAPDLVPGRTVRGLATYMNNDRYRITVDEPTTLKFSVTLHACWFNVYFGDEGTTCHGFLDPKAPRANSSRTTTRTFAAMPGVYYLTIQTGRFDIEDHSGQPNFGRYDLKMTALKTKYKMTIDGPSTLAEGVRHTYNDFTFKPRTILDSAYNTFLPISLAVEQDSPVLESPEGDWTYEGRQIGTATLVATLYGRRFTKKIRVVPNVYARRKPMVGKGAGVYISHKSLRYKDRMVYAEVFVTNKTRKPLYGIRNMYGKVLDLADGYTYCRMELPDWAPEKPLRPGKTAVIRFEYDTWPYDDSAPDFRTKRIVALIDDGSVPSWSPLGKGAGGSLIPVAE